MWGRGFELSSARVFFTVLPDFCFTYATNSELWGSGGQNGKYSAKVYNIDGVLIYQVDDGSDNSAKSPLGGVIYQGSVAKSMLDAIANPIIYYGNPVVNQAGYSRDLYNYYWTSYSRGTDGANNNTTWHNAYLDGYIPLRVKSIYDPCPYLYRIPSNGTYNQFTFTSIWTNFSYSGGSSWNMTTLGESWFSGLGLRIGSSSVFSWTGSDGFYRSSTSVGQTNGYLFLFTYNKGVFPNRDNGSRSYGSSVRCIEGFNVTFVAPKVTKMPNAKSTSASL